MCAEKNEGPYLIECIDSLIRRLLLNQQHSHSRCILTKSQTGGTRGTGSHKKCSLVSLVLLLWTSSQCDGESCRMLPRNKKAPKPEGSGAQSWKLEAGNWKLF